MVLMLSELGGDSCTSEYVLKISFPLLASKRPQWRQTWLLLVSQIARKMI